LNFQTEIVLLGLILYGFRANAQPARIVCLPCCPACAKIGGLLLYGVGFLNPGLFVGHA